MLRGRLSLRTVRLQTVDASSLRRVLLAVCFAVGALMGHGYAGVCAGDDGQALQQYLREVCALWAAEGVQLSLYSCVLLYGGYALAAFLLGFASVGALLIPLLSGAFGFLSMYTASCGSLAGRGLCWRQRCCWCGCSFRCPAFWRWPRRRGRRLRSWRCWLLAEADVLHRCCTADGILLCLVCVLQFWLWACAVSGW